MIELINPKHRPPIDSIYINPADFVITRKHDEKIWIFENEWTFLQSNPDQYSALCSLMCDIQLRFLHQI